METTLFAEGVRARPVMFMHVQAYYSDRTDIGRGTLPAAYPYP